MDIKPPSLSRVLPQEIPQDISQELQDALEAGFDISLIELNLSLSHEQRLAQHQSALSLVLELEKIRAARVNEVDPENAQ